jgi:hypothetical protein
VIGFSRHWTTGAELSNTGSGMRAELICSEVSRAPKYVDETIPAECYSPIFTSDIVRCSFELAQTVWCSLCYGLVSRSSRCNLMKIPKNGTLTQIDVKRTKTSQ